MEIEKLLQKVKGSGLDEQLEVLYDLVTTASLVDVYESDITSFLERYCRLTIIHGKMRLVFKNPITEAYSVILEDKVFDVDKMKKAIIEFVYSNRFIREVANAFMELMAKGLDEVIRDIRRLRDFVEQFEEQQDC